LVLDFID